MAFQKLAVRALLGAALGFAGVLAPGCVLAQADPSLPAGQHQLQIVAANHQSEVTSHVQPSAPVSVTVQ